HDVNEFLVRMNMRIDRAARRELAGSEARADRADASVDVRDPPVAHAVIGIGRLRLELRRIESRDVMHQLPLAQTSSCSENHSAAAAPACVSSERSLYSVMCVEPAMVTSRFFEVGIAL